MNGFFGSYFKFYPLKGKLKLAFSALRLCFMRIRMEKHVPSVRNKKPLSDTVQSTLLFPLN
jgi:hypothetical protein